MQSMLRVRRVLHEWRTCCGRGVGEGWLKRRCVLRARPLMITCVPNIRHRRGSGLKRRHLRVGSLRKVRKAKQSQGIERCKIEME